MSKLVSFEIAKLAKEAGFDDKQCMVGYLKDGTESYDFGLDWRNNTAIGAPTQDELTSWLEEKGKYIYIRPEFYADGINWNWQVLWYLPKEEWTMVEHGYDDNGNPLMAPIRIMTGTGLYGDNGEYPTRHLAIDAALKMGIMKLDPFYKNNSIGGLAKLFNIHKNEMIDKIRQFSEELGDWGVGEISREQLDIIISKLGNPLKP